MERTRRCLLEAILLNRAKAGWTLKHGTVQIVKPWGENVPKITDLCIPSLLMTGVSMLMGLSGMLLSSGGSH